MELFDDWRNIENSVFQVLNTHEGCFGGYDSMQSNFDHSVTNCEKLTPNAATSNGVRRYTVLTSSTSSSVNGPPNLCFPKSIREGCSSSMYVNALRSRGYLFFRV